MIGKQIDRHKQVDPYIDWLGGWGDRRMDRETKRDLSNWLICMWGLASLNPVRQDSRPKIKAQG